MTIVQSNDQTSQSSQAIPNPEQDPQKSISTKKGPAGRKAIGSISSLDDLIANAEKTQNQQKEMKTKWDIETIMAIWQDHTNKLDTASTQNALNSAKISLKGDTEIEIVTPNKINTATVKKEMPLIERIRNSYPDRVLHFNIYEDIDQFPELTKVEPIKKSKTNQEKLEILVDKNPKVAEFIERFNLKLDK